MKTKDIVIFDIDRTIYDGSIGQDFIIELVNQRIISPKILAQISFEMLEYELDIQGYNKTVKDALSVLSKELEGKDEKVIQEIATKVIQYNHYKFYDYVFEIPTLFKEIDFLIISLEPQILVSEIAKYLKIPNYLSNEFKIKDSKIIAGTKIETDKVALLENSVFKNRNIIGAFGDSENDLNILNKAKLKIAINPTPNLLKKIQNDKSFKIINPKVAYDEFKKYIINFV
jgi:phosphoserine phosphatase